MDTFTDRIAALHPFTHYGPEYLRGVADALADVRLLVGRGETASEEHFLLLAKLRADHIDAETFAARCGRSDWAVLGGDQLRARHLGWRRDEQCRPA